MIDRERLSSKALICQREMGSWAKGVVAMLAIRSWPWLVSSHHRGEHAKAYEGQYLVVEWSGLRRRPLADVILVPAGCLLI